MAALGHAPAEVGPAAGTGAGRYHVHLLPGVLADIGDVEVAGGGVEAESPGVAEPVAPDLGPGVGLPHERVIGRDCVAGAIRNVHSQNVPEEVGQ